MFTTTNIIIMLHYLSFEEKRVDLYQKVLASLQSKHAYFGAG